MMSTQEQIVKNSQNKKSEIYEILETLRQRDSFLFYRIVDAIHNQDDYTSRVLANVAQIRKTISRIEKECLAIITSNQKCPDLELCPNCCSPEVSISRASAQSRCHCLDCGKNWIIEFYNNNPKGIEKTWSLA